MSVFSDKLKISTAIFGLAANFALFLLKLYVGISSNSLSIYCDAINNLGDTLSCIIAIVGFAAAVKLTQRRSNRLQSLCSFVIGCVVAVAGAYFAYSGVERMMYPVVVTYSVKYAALVALTVIVKVIMGIVYTCANKKESSPVLKTLALDSFLDCAITAAALMGFSLTVKINFAIDGIVGIVIGIIAAAGAVKTAVQQAKSLIND
ncbi:MAG: cation diffusion facilitator family transporter [Eubacterium sp.]